MPSKPDSWAERIGRWSGRFDLVALAALVLMGIAALLYDWITA
jgi:hypothetical protein